MLQGASCSTTSGPRLADVEGGVKAGVRLAPWPIHCVTAVPHADVAVGGNPVSALKRERGQLDFANQRAVNCGAWYDQQKVALEAAQ